MVEAAAHAQHSGISIHRQNKRCEDRGQVGELRARGAVGGNEAVDHEVAVVHGLAEVAAVEGADSLAAPVRIRHTAMDAVLDPLPHKPAHEARVAVEQLLVLGHAAGARAHGVHVLAEHEGHGAAARVKGGRLRADGSGRQIDERRVGERGLLAPPDRLNLGVRRVHAAPHVDVAALLIALVVQGPRGVTPANLRGHRGQVAPRARLVAERPHDDRRVVLVALDHARGTVAQRGLPRRIVGRVAPPAHIAETVCLEIALVDHPEAELVGEVEHVGVRRVVRGTDRVHVGALHQQQVELERLARHRPPEVGVVLVAVHAKQLHGRPVDGEDAIDDCDRAKTNAHFDRLAALIGGTRRHPQRVQLGALCRPRPGIRNRHLDAGRHLQAEFDEFDRHVSTGCRTHVDPQARAARPPRGGHRTHVVDGKLGPLAHGDGADDAGVPPLILIFEVRGGAEGVHAHDEHVVGREQAAHVEHGRQAAAARRAHECAVEPDVAGALNALEP